MSYTNFQVGEAFPLPIKASGEGGLFQFDVNGPMFILKLNNSDLIAVEAFRTGQIEIALFFEDNIIFFLYKVEGILNDWGDCPSCLCTLPKNQLPNLTNPQSDLALFLVNNNLNTLLALRNITLTPEFYDSLSSCINKQLQTPISIEEYQQKVQALWQKYSSTEMFNHAIAHQLITTTLS